MRKIIGLLIITLMILSNITCVQAQIYNDSFYSYAPKSENKSKIRHAKTRNTIKREAQKMQGMAAAKIDYLTDENETGKNISPIIKPLKNNYYQCQQGQKRELPESKLKSNYHKD